MVNWPEGSVVAVALPIATLMLGIGNPSVWTTVPVTVMVAEALMVIVALALRPAAVAVRVACADEAPVAGGV